MARHTIPIDRYIEAAQVFHWFTKEQIILWFLGSVKRHRRTESVLLKLVRQGRLRCVKYGKRLVYTVPRRTKGKLPVLLKEKRGYEPKITEAAIAGRNKIVHGLACTECLVRFYRAKLDGEIIAERFFYRLGAVPEWGIRYPNEKILLLEFCTADNFRHSNMMKGKINAYLTHLEKIEEKFQAKATVLFVIDVPRDTVESFVGNLLGDVGSVADGDPSASPDGDGFPLTPFFFTDYKKFLSVPFGQQLVAPIYLWTDGKEYPLKKHD